MNDCDVKRFQSSARAALIKLEILNVTVLLESNINLIMERENGN